LSKAGGGSNYSCFIAKYSQILKNSVASKETARERIFLMKDQVAVEWQ
jgi:hypothetical protein